MMTVYKASRFNQPIEVRPELGEIGTPLADMLRYDLAFQNPADLSEIVFPIFKSKHGATSRQITLGRWHSFSTKLEAVREMFDNGVLEWITYIHPSDKNGTPDYANLAPKTLREVMLTNKWKLAARHR